MAVDSNTSLANRPVKEVYAVSRLVREARGALEGAFSLTWVEGEISNLAMPASGHIYFTLKDEAAQVRCAMFKMRNRQLRFTPKNGMQVLLRVRVTLYEGRGEFQLVVEHMEEAGSGALQHAYEALKHRLGEEGLFSQDHKKQLTLLPKCIGVVSSPDGAAVHDILTVLRRRFPAANVILYPVAVQGVDSAQQITRSINLANQRQECETLIISRGGGSLEDLWSFNDEAVARAIFASTIPVISAVGHEVDFTIADFVADVRAPTPSAAAEIAVPEVAELMGKTQAIGRRLHMLMAHRLQSERHYLNNLQQRLPSPLQTIKQKMQNLEQLTQRLNRSSSHNLNNKRQQLDYWSVRLKHPQAQIKNNQYQLANLAARLQTSVKSTLDSAISRQLKLQQRLQLVSPHSFIKQQQQNIEHIETQLNQSIMQIIGRHQGQLDKLLNTLAVVSPLNTLKRGYSITTQADSGRVVSDIDEVEVGQTIAVQLEHGQLKCEVQSKSNKDA
ncbi:MAG: exodeoxyribonuclease VII large subunit [Gammaproteobacteria bacterium]|nr:MAG: exodeoxyribonuclease VII large subunit [Gammaproteobacteria bacterium]